MAKLLSQLLVTLPVAGLLLLSVAVDTHAAGRPAATTALDPYPYASLVSEGESGPELTDFVLSAVEKIRREVAIEQWVQTEAVRRWQTYELPQDANLTAVATHYTQQLPGKILFRCQARDCGRSNTWANQVFKQALLYGRDQQQVYVAAATDTQLISVYLVRRGNRRQYVHVSVLTPTVMPVLPTLAGERSAEWLTQLGVRGAVQLLGVVPAANGALSDNARRRLQSVAQILAAELGQAMSPLTQQPLVLVCHLYAPRVTSESLLLESLANAQQCAQSALEVMQAQAPALSDSLLARGIGPLAPWIGGNLSGQGRNIAQVSADGRQQARLVLVAPALLTR